MMRLHKRLLALLGLLILLLIVSIWFTRRPPRLAGGAPVDAGGAH